MVERPAADRLRQLVNFGNKGDERGEAGADPLTISAGEMRRIADGWAQGFGFDGNTCVGAITLNRPYTGAFETVHYGAELAALNEPRVGAVQVEFLRETLLGPHATAHLQQPDADWPDLDRNHLDGIMSTLVVAGRLLR